MTDRVKVDPHLRARANRSFKVWCTLATVLLAAPVVWLFLDLPLERSTWELVVLAIYVLPVVIVGAYTFEKIKTT